MQIAHVQSWPEEKRPEDTYKLVRHRAELALDLWVKAHPEHDYRDHDEYDRLLHEFAFQHITCMSRDEYFEKYATKIAQGWTPTVSFKQHGRLRKPFCIGFQRVTGRYAVSPDWPS